MDNKKLYHMMGSDEVLKELNTGLLGLSDREALMRLEKYGKNELEEGKKKTIVGKFIDQFANLMIIVLLIAAFISGFMGEFTDAMVIISVVLINAILGVLQESKAEKALEALKKMSTPLVKVKRNGNINKIKTELLVYGDIVTIEAGDYIPADLRLFEVANLKIDESAITGESLAVEKYTHALKNPNLVIGDRKNMAYSGSIVTYGRGTGVVIKTGMETEVGRIARRITDTEDSDTPLQRGIDSLSKVLSIAIIAIAAIMFFVGIANNRDPLEMFLTAVSLAVAAIPEGLPAVITIVLAIGVQKMAKRNAIIRKLSAVETLGCTEIICSDKTGTLTQNKMTIKEVYVNRKVHNEDEVNGKDKINLDFFQIMTLCNDSKVIKDKNKRGQIKLIGDPTENALVQYAYKNKIDNNEFEVSMKRVGEIPFDSDRKLMTTLHRFNNGYRAMTKGAPDILLSRCSKILINEKEFDLTRDIKDEIIKANTQMAGKALRILGMAYRNFEIMPKDLKTDIIEKDLVFVGLTGMIDPPRPEVKVAVETCRAAGIRPIMITGDHKDTAVAISKELGIIISDSEAITGAQLDKVSENEFINIVNKYSVYARVSPEHKVRIVEAWKRLGKIVAMTGDGVNDAPALKAADIGVGMGLSGTDVAKGVSNMVLADDNFATIVYAVEEGRKVYSNITKTIQFLLSCNLGEVLTLFLATIFFRTEAILLPIHILWINLVTDTLPALSLGVEKNENDIMKRKPRAANSSFLSEGMGASILYQGIAQGGISLLVYCFGNAAYSHEVGMTMCFMTLGLIQLSHAYNVKSNRSSIFKVGVFSNPYLVYSTIIATFLQVIVVFVPFLRQIFKVEALNTEQWLLVLVAVLSIIPIVEIVKLVTRVLSKNK